MPPARDTVGVPPGGSSRKLIARQLNAAYAESLLSEDTYVRRLDELLGSAVIDSRRLSGDLNLRRSRRTAVEAARRWQRRLHLMLRDEGLPGMVLALDSFGERSELTIGRHHGCDVVLGDPEISRRHAHLRLRDGRWVLQDLESTNGTYVNGVRVGRCQLRPGDHVSVGGVDLVID